MQALQDFGVVGDDDSMPVQNWGPSIAGLDMSNIVTYARRDVDEGTAAPHSAVQRRKLVVRGGHALHEVLLHHVGVGAGQGALHIGVDDALRRDLLLGSRVDA